MKNIPFRFASCAAVLGAFIFSGCATMPGSGHAAAGAPATRPAGPADLVALNLPDPATKEFPITSYQVNHIWGGEAGYKAKPGPNYRAKISLLTTGGALLAELFFVDPPTPAHPFPVNPDPNNPIIKQPYALYFPIDALDGVLEQLRTARAPVSLYFYNPAGEMEWAVGSARAEKAGG